MRSARPLAVVAAVFLSAGCTKMVLRPPTPADLERAASFDWQIDRSEHFVHYVERGSPGERMLDHLKVISEESMQRVLGILGLEVYEGPAIHQFAVGSRGRMRDLIGRETNGTAFPQSAMVCIVVTETWSSAGAHELFHVLVRQHWGSGSRWLNEGLAVFADDSWHGNELHTLAHYLDVRGRLVSLPTLMRRFHSVDDLIAYPQAGSFAKYLFGLYGRDQVERLWRAGDRSVESILGKPVEELEREWLDAIRATRIQDVEYGL